MIPMSYQKILVALDQISSSSLAFDHALQLAQLHQSQIRLVHCLSINSYDNLGTLIDSGAGLRSSAQVQRQEKVAQLQKTQEAQKQLKQLLAEALKLNLKADFVCETADPGRYICQLAKDWEADVIVIGNSGKKGLKKLILGSVSQYVSNHAPCRTIVVPNDGSPEIELPAN